MQVYASRSDDTPTRSWFHKWNYEFMLAATVLLHLGIDVALRTCQAKEAPTAALQVIEIAGPKMMAWMPLNSK